MIEESMPLLMGNCCQIVIISALTCLSQIPQVMLQENCANTGHCSHTNWVHLWYIWLVVIIGSLLLLCGLVAVCLRCCFLNCRPADEAATPRPYELTVITLDHDSTLQSTIASVHSMFGSAARRILAVAHSHSVVPATTHPTEMEKPPVYEEVVHMSRFTVSKREERAPHLEPLPEEKQAVDFQKEDPQPNQP
uniref:Transmembrane protein 52B n=1 Tax=Salvator merianae TaxID=96440 RepID=A0A8D0BA97_SALMN